MSDSLEARIGRALAKWTVTQKQMLLSGSADDPPVAQLQRLREGIQSTAAMMGAISTALSFAIQELSKDARHQETLEKIAIAIETAMEKRA